MSRKLTAAGIVVVALGVAAVTRVSANQDVLINGIVVDCYPEGEVPVADVEVFAFDAQTHASLATTLRLMDTTDLNNAALIDRYEANYQELWAALAGGTAAARDTTAADGAYSLSVPPRDSVIVISHKVREDEPYYFAWAMTPALENTPVNLDMSGQCRK